MSSSATHTEQSSAVAQAEQTFLYMQQRFGLFAFERFIHPL